MKSKHERKMVQCWNEFEALEKEEDEVTSSNYHPDFYQDFSSEPEIDSDSEDEIIADISIDDCVIATSSSSSSSDSDSDCE
jgi:hypothetical protein